MQSACGAVNEALARFLDHRVPYQGVSCVASVDKSLWNGPFTIPGLYPYVTGILLHPVEIVSMSIRTYMVTPNTVVKSPPA